MPKGEIYITRVDRDKLLNILSRTLSLGHEDRQLLKSLEEELARARIVEPREIPCDAVTMNSQVRVEDLDTGEEETYTIVFPGQADYRRNRVSVLAPVGTALLGYRTGDVIEWPMPRGVRRMKIKQIVFQPEAHNQDLA